MLLMNNIGDTHSNTHTLNLSSCGASHVPMSHPGHWVQSRVQPAGSSEAGTTAQGASNHNPAAI